MELLFFLDTAEYIRGITPDDGLQVTIHPPNTMPFPADEGLAVAAGTFTMLSLKLVRVCVCVRACVRACVRECVRACVRACVSACLPAC